MTVNRHGYAQPWHRSALESAGAGTGHKHGYDVVGNGLYGVRHKYRLMRKLIP